jgi:HNH endonuclease
MASADEQIQFLTRFQRLLNEGSFVSTYKYALLMALADLSVELGGESDESLEIETSQIAEKFVEYYWRQSAPYFSSESAVLRQNTGKQAGIVNLLHETRQKFNGNLVEAKMNFQTWKPLIGKIRRLIQTMPLWKLQTVGGEQMNFLYGNLKRGSAVQLKPGVSFCLRSHYPLIADLVKGAWARYVRRFNADFLGPAQDINDFLFGSERSNLFGMAPILKELQHGECFYCRQALKADSSHVDHFIPWSRYPVDLGPNLVLAHGSCNEQKSDRIAAIPHLERWVTFVQENQSNLVDIFVRCGLPNNVHVCAQIADWAYNQTHQINGLTWLRRNELEKLPTSWNISLAPLQHGLS